MKLPLSIAIILLFAGHPYLLCAQNTDNYITSQRLLSVEDGLASREVFCGLQDSQGFIWLGTRNGLNRYDGKNFLLFTDHNGLRENKVLNAAEDGEGNLWISYGSKASSMESAHMVDILNLTTHQIKTFAASFKQKPFDENNIGFITADGNYGIFIVTVNHEIWHYTTGDGFKLWYHQQPADYPFWYTNNGFGNPHAFVSPVNLNGLLLVNKGSAYKSLAGAILYPDSTRPHGFCLLPLLFDSANNCIAMSRSNYVETLCSIRQGKTTVISSVPAAISKTEYSCYDPATNTCCILSPEGLFCYNGSRLIPVLSKDVFAKYPDMQERGYFTDKTGKRWICTTIGVFITTSEHNKFTQYFTSDKLNVPYSNQARGIYADTSGHIFANIWNSLCYTDKNDATGHTYSLGGLCYPVLAYNNSSFYSFGYHIWEFNKPGSNFIQYGPQQNIWAAVKLNNGKLLLAESNGFELFDPATKKVSPASCNNDSFPVIGCIYRFFKDHDNRLWAVGENGLYIINAGGCIIDYYGDKAKNKDRILPFAGLNDAYQDEQGIFWLAASGQGLARWNRQNNTLQWFSVKEGFSSNIMYRIEADTYHNLWISTDYGLARFNITNHSVYTYTTKDGISHNEFNRISSFKADDGRMYFGGLDGVNAFNPEDFFNDTGLLDAPLRITGFTQFDGSVNKLVDKTIDLAQSHLIELNPGDRFFNLEFRLLDYATEQHLYSYKIEGLDKDWTFITENSIRISGLPYGNFTLKIKGQNINGQQAKHQLELAINVIRPFYMQGWFFVLLGLSAAALVYLFVYFRTLQLERDNIKLETNIAGRTKELRQSLYEKEVLLKEIHHRVKNNLQTISSLLDLQGRNIDDKSAKDAVLEGQNRVRSIALIHQNLYQNENFEAIEFGTFMNDLADSVKAVFLKNGDQFKFVNQIPQTYFDIDTAVPLGLIANELLTNSFKYAFDKNNELRVSVYLEHRGSGEYKLVFHDSGPGLPASFDIENAKSLGLRLINRLCEQLDGRLNYYYDNGSVFEIFLKDTETRKMED